MYHPTTRVLTILALLQAHPQLSGAELAERLEVDLSWRPCADEVRARRRLHRPPPALGAAPPRDQAPSRRRLHRPSSAATPLPWVTR